MTIRTKALPADKVDTKFSAYTGEVGVISFYASVYGTVDLVGDVVINGAFDDWLQKAKAAKQRIPVLWSHQFKDAGATIGYIDAKDIVSDAYGLKFTRAVLDLENSTAATVWRNIKAGATQGASFSYDTISEAPGASGENLLLELELLEAGPCAFGINRDAGRFETKAKPDTSDDEAALDAAFKAEMLELDAFIASDEHVSSIWPL